MTTPDRPEPEDARLLDLACRVTDDLPVDWEFARQSESDLGETLERLRQLQTIGELNRRGDEPAAARPVFAWGPLRALERLGEGAFGEVWRAWDPALQREVALKLRRGDASRPEDSRWLREAQRLARVRHRHVLTVHGTDVHDGRAGIWTDLIRGRTLEHLLVEHGPFGAGELTSIGLDLCAALAAVHDAGLVHGDVKTRNVMREGARTEGGSAAGAGRIVLMDFGTASERSGEDPGGATPLFAAPELLAGAPPGVASDLYALGVVLYRLATGRFPLEAATLAELRARHARREATPLRTWRPDLPGALVQVIERALAPEPAQRFASAGEMERALMIVFAPGAATRSPDASARWRFATGVLVGGLLVAVALAGYGVLRARRTPHFELARPLDDAPFVLAPLVPETALGQGGGNASIALGDIDGDGHPDVATSAIYEDRMGVTRILLGDGRGGVRRTIVVHGREPLEVLGCSLACGDLNGDGHPDLVISALGSAEKGSVYVVWGGPALDSLPGIRLAAPRPGGAFGYAITCGDWNGDGIADLAVGANADNGGGAQPTGRVYVYFGGARMHTRPDLELGCDSPDANFGTTVDLGGDLNGDGIADLAVGAQWESTDGIRAGRAYVYYGGRPPATRPGLVLHSPGPWHLFGPARFVGDLDGDGFDDLLVTDERGDGFEHGAGAALLYRGSNQPSAAPALVFRGEHEGDGFGRWAANVGDVDGDGHADLAIAAWWADVGGPTSGEVYVYRGGPGMSTLPAARIPGPVPEGRFGTSVAAAGDLDGDGFPEILIGAPSQSRTALGGTYLASFHRYVLTRPRADETWDRGGQAVVAWEGSTSARLEWSANGGAWRPWLERAGGRSENVVHVRVPEEAQGALRIRLVAARPNVRGVAESGPIAIRPAR